MASLKDLNKLVNGLSLVAKEAMKQGNLDKPDLQSLIKQVVLSATDISGLTKGEVRNFTVTGPKLNQNLEEGRSVVYFEEVEASSTDDIPSATSSDQSISIDANFDSHSTTFNAGREGNGESVSLQAEIVIPPANLKSNDAAAAVEEKAVSSTALPPIPPPLVKKQRRRERKFLRFAGLGAGLAWGTIQESAKRIVYGTTDSQGKQSALSPYLSEKNAERLALALCRMRGAALKLGQMLSIQDESLVPAPILAALDIVRQGADVMPKSQLNEVLDHELGVNWSSKLKSFDYEPLAAASIGQVHKAVTKDGFQVAMKIQYPGVADSIDSDIDNVKLLLDYTNLIPKNLYLDRAMKVSYIITSF
ncbi:Protein kinase-like domain-containing protein [Cynara cardunculus var. scolymus]|uniref:Protein kinase-like domain-containing protein n=1 Tax=Cynara cardunculus var. scolymus TaxID=59895 RepID=A0A118K4K9_CYNCS|nr:Protein kinase-like domain-containing protein [Cynara cardunculus var. scolymus]